MHFNLLVLLSLGKCHEHHFTHDAKFMKMHQFAFVQKCPALTSNAIQCLKPPPSSKRPVDLTKYVDRYNGGHNFGVLAAKLNAISDLIMIPQLKKVKNSLEYIPYGGQLLEMIKNIRSIFRL